MRKPMAKKVLAASMAAAMLMSAGCGKEAAPAASTPAANDATEASTSTEEVVEEVSKYPVITDENGNAIDLGGMEITIRDWWTAEYPVEPRNEYEEARQEWRDFIQETYNFTIKEQGISDWESTPQDFIDYVTSGGDDNNYIFILDTRSGSAMTQGLMYDLATLDCLDFSDVKFQSNKTHEVWSSGDHIYGMATGKSEPKTGIWFNKRLMTEAGIDPASIYEMQNSGKWDWAAFETVCETIVNSKIYDPDGDGVPNVYPMGINESNMTHAAVWSNGGEYVGNEGGKLVYKLGDAATLEALNWVNEMYGKYDAPDDPDVWDIYKQQVVNGQCVMLPDDSYCGTAGNLLCDSEDDWGFVMFPYGPRMDRNVNCWSNNENVIPSCYDADRAWKIAFAYNLYRTEPAGYEDYIDLSNLYAGKYDEDAVNTYLMMQEPVHGITTSTALVPKLNDELGPQLTWSIGAAGTADIAALEEAVRESWNTYVDEINNK